MDCKHTNLHLDPSPFAELAGFEQPDAPTRAAAETLSGKTPKILPKRPNTTFPGPLVLPHDDLNYDPDCPPQSCRSWSTEKARNKLTDPNRHTLYISRVPRIAKGVSFMQQWTIPNPTNPKPQASQSPDADDFTSYLRAFYHGMNVRILPQHLTWTTWGKATGRPNRLVSLPKHIGLSSLSTGATTRIRVRSGPDKAFPAQLNLDDIIDTAISILPDDAYALLLLVDHDIYESEDDDFCCGRAYGGSRVAVVQTARYNPVLDVAEGIDRAHMWPMSHCKRFVDGLCAVEDVVGRPATKEQKKGSRAGAMRAAVDAAGEFADVESEGDGDDGDGKGLWFARLARTVSHELGHCFGIAHCVHYACNMQGTAGMTEDVRQPPYLCPICEAKVGNAIVREMGGGGEAEKEEWILERGNALKDFCRQLDALQSPMWAGLNAWLSVRHP